MAATIDIRSAYLTERGRVVADNRVPHLADRLNFLFAHIPRQEGEGTYSNEQAATALQDSGISATGTYISQMRAGTRTNPSAAILHGLARLFGVEISYFFDDDVARQVEEQIATLEAMRDHRVRSVMARAAGLSEDRFTQAVQDALQAIRDEERRSPADEAGR